MLSRLETIAVKHDLALGLMGDADRVATLAFAAIHFVPGTAYDERSVNALLVDWLGRGGAMLRTDHVELRRWLVDGGWLERDGFGRRYALAVGAPARAASVLGDASADALTAAVARVRAVDAQRRAERRARHVAAAP